MTILKRSPTSVAVSWTHRGSPAVVWEAASHPAALATAVPMLNGFWAPSRLKLGSKLAERHTIMGLPQLYRGAITVYEHLRRWGMTSRPVSWGLFPLPHDVIYDFAPVGPNTTLTIRCDFWCSGLLRFPMVSMIVAWLMKRAIRSLQEFIETRVIQRQEVV